MKQQGIWMDNDGYGGLRTPYPSISSHIPCWLRIYPQMNFTSGGITSGMSPESRETCGISPWISWDLASHERKIMVHIIYVIYTLYIYNQQHEMGSTRNNNIIPFSNQPELKSIEVDTRFFEQLEV
jgi:hypothetical protein